MYYAEQKKFDGTWVPATFTDRPLPGDKTSGTGSNLLPGGGRREFRNVWKVPESLQHLTLDQLRHVAPGGKFHFGDPDKLTDEERDALAAFMDR